MEKFFYTDFLYLHLAIIFIACLWSAYSRWFGSMLLESIKFNILV